MSLNPVQFGTEVIDQFGRYLMTTFPIADPGMEEQVRRHLRHDLGGERLIAKGPYVFINAAFEQGPSVAALCAEPKLGLHPVLKSVFPYESLHKHQELALRAIKAGRHAIIASGTGSGKTEAFLLPIVDHALHLRDAGAAPGIVAVLIYPMNALVDDQLRRLRPLLAGTGVTFGRYTGVTPEESEPERGRLRESRAYTARERDLLREGKEEKVPLPWEECYTRQEIRERRPRILLTNFSQLEYLLLRDVDLGLFRDAPLRFFVMDEVHTYTGALGSEVACLLRRLRHVAGRKAEEVICVGTSATVQQPDGGIDAGAAVRSFAARLFGVDRERVDLVTERYDAYFVQGYQGLGCSLDSQGEAKVHFDAEAGHDEEGAQVFPLVLCRSCGQHHFPLIAEEPVQRNGVGVRRTRTDTPVERGDEDEPLSRVCVTNRLVGLDEAHTEAEPPADAWLCRICGAIQDAKTERCANDRCERPGTPTGAGATGGSGPRRA